MSYISVIQAAEKWKITRRRVQILCNNNRIEGAQKIGTVWIIPGDAPKPTDARLKNNENNIENRGSL